MRIKVVQLLAIIFVMAFTSSCKSIFGSQPVGNPADTARAYFDAVLNGRANSAQYVCSSLRTNNMKPFLDQIRMMTSPNGSAIDISGVKFEIASQDGDTARIKVTGRVKSKATGYDLGLASPNVSMTYENGWKVCGF